MTKSKKLVRFLHRGSFRIEEKLEKKLPPERVLPNRRTSYPTHGGEIKTTQWLDPPLGLLVIGANRTATHPNPPGRAPSRGPCYYRGAERFSLLMKNPGN